MCNSLLLQISQAPIFIYLKAPVTLTENDLSGPDFAGGYSNAILALHSGRHDFFHDMIVCITDTDTVLSWKEVTA